MKIGKKKNKEQVVEKTKAIKKQKKAKKSQRMMRF